jgi:alkylhydroperoxidase/carboxymuconolactone decarboxylase family protein YurZ
MKRILNKIFGKKVKEEKNMADPAEEANEYMKKKMLFTPRMFKVINTVAPNAGKTFADFYESIWADGALPRKIKELMLHVIPAAEAGATFEEVFEAVAVGMIGAGFVPGGPGIPYAFEYAAKCLEVYQKHKAGEDWEYLKPPTFNRGVY